MGVTDELYGERHSFVSMAQLSMFMKLTPHTFPFQLSACKKKKTVADKWFYTKKRDGPLKRLIKFFIMFGITHTVINLCCSKRNSLLIALSF